MKIFNLSPDESDPFALFSTWFDEAKTTEIRDPEAMALACVDKSGRPSLRTVLLKGYDRRGFVFFTNAESRKGAQIAETGVGAMLFHWKSLGRQIAIEGSIEKTSAFESDSYFATRPRGSQIGAWASAQSRPLDSRQTLMDRVETIDKKYDGQPVPRPPYWCGYRLAPARMEFWQEGGFRLHDRFAFTRLGAEDWSVERLNP